MILSWIKSKLGITELERKVALQDVRIDAMRSYVEAHIKELNDLTRADVDVPVRRSNGSIVLTGVYKGKGFVRFYDLEDWQFSEVLNIVKDMTKDRKLRNVDKPYSFHGSFDLY